MREPENCAIPYCGFKNPKKDDELEFEILGLENAIRKIEERISFLKQTKYLVNLALTNNSNSLKEYFEKEKESANNNSEIQEVKEDIR